MAWAASSIIRGISFPCVAYTMEYIGWVWMTAFTSSLFLYIARCSPVSIVGFL